MQLDIFSLQENPVSEERDFSACLIMAAQYVMALNFTDEFEIVDIDLAGDTGLKIIRSGKKALSPKIYDHLALINISGICSLSINRYGTDCLKGEMHKLPEDASYLLLEGNEEAYISFKKNLRPVSRAFLLKPIQTEWSTLLKALQFFLETEVYQAVCLVSSILRNHHQPRISHSEIFAQLPEQGFYENLLATMLRFKGSRYPLSKATFNIEFSSKPSIL